MDQLTGGPWIKLYEVCSTCNGMGSSRPSGAPYAAKCQDCDENKMSPRMITLPELAKLLRKAK
jgi:hypothetical protein